MEARVESTLMIQGFSLKGLPGDNATAVPLCAFFPDHHNLPQIHKANCAQDMYSKVRGAEEMPRIWHVL